MLFIVLLLVLIAFGLLIAALVTSATLDAWASLGVSVLAAVVLVLDWLRRRRSRRPATPATGSDRDGGHDGRPAAAVAAGPEGGDDPTEEDTDAADLLVVSELDDEVRVVDEHPRYHLAGCTWLHGRRTLSLRVAEARELGFSGCARCTPDATLAAAHRQGHTERR